MTDNSKRPDNPRTKANKASGLHWGIALATVLVLGFIAWELFGPDGTATTDFTPAQTQQDQGAGSGQDSSQPPAVAPSQDQGGGSVPGAPADTGAGAQ